MKLKVLICALAASFAMPALANESGDIRLFYGKRTLRPHHTKFDVTDYLRTNALPQIETMDNYGFEVGGSPGGPFAAGFRFLYSDRHAEDGTGNDGLNYSRLKHFALTPVGRLSLLNYRVIKLELLAGLGLGWAELDVHKDGADSFVDYGLGWTGFVGASTSVGFKPFMVFVEAGFGRTALDGFRHKWDERAGVHHMALSGPFVNAGINLDYGPGASKSK